MKTVLAFLCAILLSVQSSSVGCADWQSELKELIGSHEGEVAVAIKHLGSGESFVHRGDAVHPTASLIKFPVLVELYRSSEAKEVSLKKLITLGDDDKVPGSGILTAHFPESSQIPLEGVARLMIAFSDNTATNLVLDEIGLQPVNATMAKLGLAETRVHSKVYRRDTSVDPTRSEKYGLGSTTANEMLKLLELLHGRQLVSEEASKAMLLHLAACDDATKLLRNLPKSVKAFHKTGAVGNARTDAGLIETSSGVVAMVVLTSQNKDQSWGEENKAEILCGRIGEIAYRAFNTESKKETASADLQVGSSGELVEALQRTLNQKQSSPQPLTVDGDFGKMTESAVKSFQASVGLPETGIVSLTTWEKLGPLQFEDADVPAPEKVNAELLPKEPADSLDGPPFVSARAWIIANGETGEVVGHEKMDAQLDIASTTKIMTAWLVCKACESDTRLLHEQLTFSKRADETVGSSSTVRVGEKLSVHDALYGLMLPSGNDAAVALAEHFGGRFDLSDQQSDGLANFVSEMNREAARLGMMQTQYKNPHGLTADGHRSSCIDLLKLAREALKSKLLREIVQTRQHGCRLESEKGYARNVVWKNTNELLAREGYFGLKTGTTDAAGACLVSCSQRGEATQIVVILGASGSPARYADSRNLHRWGWQQRQQH